VYVDAPAHWVLYRESGDSVVDTPGDVDARNARVWLGVSNGFCDAHVDETAAACEGSEVEGLSLEARHRLSGAGVARLLQALRPWSFSVVTELPTTPIPPLSPEVVDAVERLGVAVVDPRRSPRAPELVANLLDVLDPFQLGWASPCPLDRGVIEGLRSRRRLRKLVLNAQRADAEHARLLLETSRLQTLCVRAETALDLARQGREIGRVERPEPLTLNVYHPQLGEPDRRRMQEDLGPNVVVQQG